MIITLKNQTTIAEIDTKGALVVSLVSLGRKVLYPKSLLRSRENTALVRGGMHVCLSNLGTNLNKSLENNEVNLDLEWEVTDEVSNAVTLKLIGGSETHQGLESIVKYELGENYLKSSLTLSNVGGGDLRVSPSFCPYFNLIETNQSLLLDGERMNLNQSGKTEFVSNIDKLKAGKFIYDFDVINFNKFAVWSDGLASYVCIAPTENRDDLSSDTPIILESQEFKQYIFKFSWIYAN